ncbi:helix-turn-helix domain-containing protein [Umezawaea sp. Da 62-37]|uniref:helix-turn-helix domain-containing protein n=1 Tax=Umezawaea sp. Da 62-37 TaxID=3075927 RepID=UPI0028F6E886|nr:helix-turn-helix domain-containing protein [Umezawaea sp. Da 62-37]WNV84160.1 helix-turn-helix domain-containing protein [Umezawaea sp. Da 62-37]
MCGYLFKTIRESIRLTQAELADELTVDVATVQGWESGRRSLTALRAGDLVRLRMKLTRLGAPTSAFATLNDAVEVDLIIADAIGAGSDPGLPGHHPLATSVHRRKLTNLITWPFTGITPPGITRMTEKRQTRRGPVSNHPVLNAEEQTRFFDHLLAVADTNRNSANALLRRQAIYLLGFDQRQGTAAWLMDEQRRAVRSVGPSDDVPSWLAVRSSAVALASTGNRDPLTAFVSTGLADTAQEIANLNYWAYWVGETTEVQVDDAFMTSDHRMTWSGAHLFEHLLSGLSSMSNHVELNIHTLWSLLLARPRLLESHPVLRTLARAKVDEVIDEDLTARSRQELANVGYAIRLAER